MNVIIFSKDRAMQCDALIRSYRRFVNKNHPIQVLYKCSNDDFKKGYEVLKTTTDKCEFTEITSFKEDFLKSISHNYNYTLTLVDNNLFVKNFNTNILYREFKNKELLCMSLKLRRNIQDDPPSNLFFYENGIGYFRNPATLDGCVYRTNDLIKLIKISIFNSPQTFTENAAVKETGKKYVYINETANVVVIENNSNLKALNDIFTKGKVININPFMWRDYSEITIHENFSFHYRR